MDSSIAAVPRHTDDYNASYRDNVWLGQFPLDHQSVLYYFAGSPWYDKSCNNEILKMQRRPLEHLQGMTGIEYELQPNEAKQLPQVLYVIHKKNRTSPRTANVMAVYYVLDCTIYQAPNTYTLLTSRLKKCSYRINKAFKALSAGVRFSPTEGYAWDFSTEESPAPVIPSEQLAAKLKRKYEKEEKIKQNSARVDSILFGLIKKYAPDVLENKGAAGEVKTEQQPQPDGPQAKRQKVATATTT
ncbi:hypothetical protein H257_09172 [Aphanomyces astaci]|uniref:Mediator of RNA polymerase II transcription subunit 6 n=1 Tax=Aphanomyces astaci TaxID=112090 RepID=W4GAK2_APHAT|nr:hypothetical protein H257_09172 [Aphanomyces astaci]ETV76695.1 hypothetical protein H257_09172 [Aphanomyces astaci]|eukprot:XP_009833608.1 hypothetical protein H257_09172 [Aphanomyces astaci]